MLMKSTRHLMITFLLSTLVLVAIVSINFLFTDRVHAVTGDGSFLSNLGIILWCVGASVCLFAGALLSDAQQQKPRQFLVYSGLLTAYLLFDDFFQLHELYFPKLFHIDEKVIYLLLAIAAIIIVIRFKKVILQTNYTVMLMAFGFLAIAVAADGILKPMEIVYGMLAIVAIASIYFFLFHRSLFNEYLLVIVMIIISLCAAYAALKTDIENPEYIFEEGAKWIGIASWCSYYTYTAYQLVVNAYANSSKK